MILREGIVYVQNIRTGVIRETDEGYQFVYDEAYLVKKNPLAVSLTLPTRQEPYESNVLFPFFDGLIPEGWLLNMVSRNWKIDKEDRFGLLLNVCRDCIGDVRIESTLVGDTHMEDQDSGNEFAEDIRYAKLNIGNGAAEDIPIADQNMGG